jgi:hypothetical protein
MLNAVRLTAEQEAVLQKEKLLLFSRAVVGPPAERHAAIARLRTVHHLSDQQIFSQIGATSTLCRLEENQAILMQLSTAISKLSLAPVPQDADTTQALLQLTAAVQKRAQTPPTTAPPPTQDAEAVAFRKSWLFRLWRFFYGGQS